MTKLILSTGNIVSAGPSIVRKPGAQRSNLEFTNSLRSNFLAAQQELAYPAENGATNGATNGSRNGNGSVTSPREPAAVVDAAGRPAAELWTAREDGALYVPRIDWAGAGLAEEPGRYEITAKLFFLPAAPAAGRPAYAREALALVLRELGAPAVDLLIVSFPGMSFDGDCEWEADRLNGAQGDDEEEAATWAAALEVLHDEGLARRLGIAEFGSEKLARFVRRARVPPQVDQINIKNCCDVPPPLARLAKERRIELLVHTDCTDVLPAGTLRELLGQGPDGAGVLADVGADAGAGGALRGDITPQWVIKYTAVVKDRGVIENKGYFAGAELTETEA